MAATMSMPALRKSQFTASQMSLDLDLGEYGLLIGDILDNTRRRSIIDDLDLRPLLPHYTPESSQAEALATLSRPRFPRP